ncbi:MAG: cation-translocating P-type ATPase [Clostridia bacterium]|nr:cation-translocating P-type ATPase [Clostridia bacterium]
MSREINILHNIPGRVRLEARRIYENHELAALLRERLGVIPGIKEAQTNTVTGTLLVYFDPEIMGVDKVVREVEKLSNLINSSKIGSALKADPILVEMEPQVGETPPLPCEIPEPKGIKKVFEPEDLPLRTQLIQVVFSGVILLLVTLKRVFFGRSRISHSDGVFNLAAVTAIATGYPIFRSGIEHLAVRGRLNNDFLIGAATFVSLILKESITGLVVVWLVNLSTLFQTITLDRSRKAIKEMLQATDDTAWLVVDSQQVQVPVESLEPGQVVAVNIGEKIPVDGTVLYGSATVNQASITGESIPVAKNPGDEVFAGTVVESGNLQVEVVKVGDETAVGRIIHLVEKAGSSRAPIQNIADSYSERIVPFSFALAALIYLVTGDFRRSMTMLIVACPCAAGLATPTALSAAIGNGATRGILVKGGCHLEIAGKLDTVLFDKTGTLTVGRPRVETIKVIAEGYTPEEILALAASGETQANHPLGRAVLEKAAELGLEVPPNSSCEVILGQGIRVVVKDSIVLVGNQTLLEEAGVDPARGLLEAARMKHRGQTVLMVARDDLLIGLLGIEDTLRPNALRAVEEIREEGVLSLGLVTGDSREVAEIVAHRAGIEEVWAEMLPEEKSGLVEDLRKQGRIVGMVGEGINDSPALAVADVGIAMGTGGTDVAIESAGIVLREDDPRKVASTIRLGKKTLEIIHQNFNFAIGINLVGIALGAAKVISPLTAAILHNASTLGVVINSARLLSYERKGVPNFLTALLPQQKKECAVLGRKCTPRCKLKNGC